MTVRIVHLSDLHLGDDLLLRSLTKMRLGRKRPSTDLMRGLATAVRNAAPDYVVISGDFVNAPSNYRFRQALEYLRALLRDAGIDMRCVLTVPGNHDVPFTTTGGADATRLRAYRQFLEGLYGDSDLKQKRDRYLIVDADKKLVILCLDSTLKEGQPLAEGAVGGAQIAWARAELESVQRQLGEDFGSFAKVAILHHHLVPIAGSSPAGERWMQLLDADGVEALLDAFGFNVVLHGHRHIPHFRRKIRSDFTSWTIVGAGSATCPYADQQAGHGNSFNVLEIDGEANRVSRSLWKAQENGTFSPADDGLQAPLHRMEPLGYVVGSYIKVLEITEDGTKKVRISREGLRLTDELKTLSAIPFLVVTTAPGSSIEDFGYEGPIRMARFTVKTPTIFEGAFVLNEPLRFDSAALSCSYWYSVPKGAAMTQADLARIGTDTYEASGVRVLQPLDRLKLEVVFPSLPRRYPVNPRYHVVDQGQEVPLREIKCKWDYQAGLNRAILEVRRPPLLHEVEILWEPPPVWP